MKRRDLLQGAVVGAAALAGPAAFAQDARPAWKVGGFTKMLQDLSFEKTAQVAAEIGWDGIECGVRAQGHILPERVEEDLPRMVEALRAKKLELLLMATDIQRADGKQTEKVLRAAARAGVRLYRLGTMDYKKGVSLPRQLEEHRARLKDLAALNKQLGVTGLVFNHSGNWVLGAAVWDLHEMLGDLDPRHLGVAFDIGHATVEGGLSWPTNFALIEDRVRAVIVKDFYWKHTPGVGGTPVWCPLGQGTISAKFFGMLRSSGFRGPITMQFAYPDPGAKGLDARIASYKEDNRKLREWLKA